jgi:hypothetical protein
LAAALPTVALGQVQEERDQHVRWDIIHFDFATTPPTIRPGGVADAIAANDGGRIRLTGTGTFVAPAGGGGSGVVTGGGTWATFSSAGAPTGRGRYSVTALVKWRLANFQTAGSLIDRVGNPAGRVNGYAYLRIAYDDGSRGIMGVFCHGPGAPAGIAEGVSATKGFVTYVQVAEPAPAVDANRTTFHVRR